MVNSPASANIQSQSQLQLAWPRTLSVGIFSYKSICHMANIAIGPLGGRHMETQDPPWFLTLTLTKQQYQTYVQ